MNPARVNVLWGRTGAGKSRLLNVLLADAAKLILVDTLEEHSALAPPVALADLYDMARSGGPFRASVYPVDPEDLDWIERLAASRPGVTYAVDEYSWWYPSATHQPGPGLLSLVRMGRKLRQRVYLTTQSPAAITKQICDQAALWVLPLDGVRDAEYIRARTRETIDPAELRPLATDRAGPGGDERVTRTQLACYYRGARSDYVLDTVLPALLPAK